MATVIPAPQQRQRSGIGLKVFEQIKEERKAERESARLKSALEVLQGAGDVSRDEKDAMVTALARDKDELEVFQGIADAKYNAVEQADIAREDTQLFRDMLLAKNKAEASKIATQTGDPTRTTNLLNRLNTAGVFSDGSNDIKVLDRKSGEELRRVSSQGFDSSNLKPTEITEEGFDNARNARKDKLAKSKAEGEKSPKEFEAAALSKLERRGIDKPTQSQINLGVAASKFEKRVEANLARSFGINLREADAYAKVGDPGNIDRFETVTALSGEMVMDAGMTDTHGMRLIRDINRFLPVNSVRPTEVGSAKDKGPRPRVALPDTYKLGPSSPESNKRIEDIKKKLANNTHQIVEVEKAGQKILVAIIKNGRGEVYDMQIN